MRTRLFFFSLNLVFITKIKSIHFINYKTNKNHINLQFLILLVKQI